MLTITEDELKPKIEEFIGAIGKIATDENGDPTGDVLWGMTSDKDRFAKARESKNHKTAHVKRFAELKKFLRRNSGSKIAGTADIIDIPGMDESEMRGWGDMERDPKILVLGTPQFKSLTDGIRHLKKTGEEKTWVYRFGTEPPPRDYNNSRRGCGRIPGICYTFSHDVHNQMSQLIPEALHVIRGGENVTEAAIENKKNTIPLRGSYGLRRANENGMKPTSFLLVSLTKSKFAQAIKAANVSLSDKRTNRSSDSYAPMLYKYELQCLSSALESEIRSALSGSIRQVGITVESWGRTIDQIVISISELFRVVERVVGLEKALVKEGNYNEESRNYGFVSRLMCVFGKMEVLEKWKAKDKYNGLDELIAFVDKYGKRIEREKILMKREARKRKAEADARKAAAKEKFETENQQHVQENQQQESGEEPDQGEAREEEADSED